MQDIKIGDWVVVVVDELSLGALFHGDGWYTPRCKGVHLEVVHVGAFNTSDHSAGVKYLDCSGPGMAGPIRQTILVTDVELIKE